MSDKFSVTGTVTPANPSTGDPITLTISGDNLHTVSTPGTIGPLSVAAKAKSGATTTFTVPASPCTVTTATREPVVMVSVTDPAGRVWAVSSDGLTAIAVV